MSQFIQLYDGHIRLVLFMMYTVILLLLGKLDSDYSAHIHGFVMMTMFRILSSNNLELYRC